MRNKSFHSFCVFINHLESLYCRAHFAHCWFPAARVDRFLLPLESSRGSACCSRVEGDVLFAPSWHVLSPWCFCVWVIQPLLCTSNGVVLVKGWGRWMCFSSAGPLLEKSGCASGLCCQPTAWSSVSRPLLLGLENAHGQSARKTLPPVWGGSSSGVSWSDVLSSRQCAQS